MGKVTGSPRLPFLAALQLGVPVLQDDVAAVRPTPAARLQRMARAVYPYALFLALPLLAILLFVPPPLVLVGYIGVLVVFFTRWLALSSPVPVSRINPIVLVLAISVAWGMLHAEITRFTIVPVARLLASITTMYLVLDYADRPGRLWNVAAAVVLTGVAVAFVAPFVTEPSPDKLFDATALFRPGGILAEVSNPNVVAAALAVAVPLALALLTDPEKRWRFLGAVSLPPLLIMLTLLQARSMWMATVIGMVLFAGLFRRWVLVLAAVGVLVVLAYGAASPQLDLPRVPIGMSQVLGLLQGRRQVWDLAANLIVHEPLGIGINTYANYANNLASDWLAAPQREHAHNLFLQVGLDLGLVGLGAFAALFAYAFYAAWHAIRHSIKHSLACGVFVSLVVAFLGGMFEVNMWGNKAAVLLWALFGMAIVLGRYGARERTPRRHRHREPVSAG